MITKKPNQTDLPAIAGNGLIVLSCLGSAFVNSYSKKLLATFSAAEVLLFTFLCADAVLLVFAVVEEPRAFLLLNSIGWYAWFSLLVMAVFSLSLSMVLYFWVIERIDVTQASLSTYLLPVMGVIFSTVLLGEKLTAHLVAGAALVFGSTFIVTVLEHRSGESRKD